MSVEQFAVRSACAVAWAVAMPYTGRRARAVPASRRFLGWRQQPDSVLRVHGAQMRGFRGSGQVHGCEVLSFFAQTLWCGLREDLRLSKGCSPARKRASMSF